MIEQEITLLTNGRISFQKCGNGLQFGYSKNRGVYSIKVKTSGEWNGLTIRAFWHIPDIKEPITSLLVDNVIRVPALVTSYKGEGRIVFEGSDGAKTVTSADVRYYVNKNSGTCDGTIPEPGTPAWQELVGTVKKYSDTAVEAKESAKKSADEAKQALEDTKDVKSQAIEEINSSKTAVIEEIENKKNLSIEEINSVKEDAKGELEALCDSTRDFANQAKEAADKAKASELAAKDSELKSKESERLASEYKNSANESANAALKSEENASISESNATEAANRALISENNAKLSETASDNSSKKAFDSETKAKASEINSSNNAVNAEHSAINAAASADAAKGSEDKAKTSEIISTANTAEVAKNLETVRDIKAEIDILDANVSANAASSNENANNARVGAEAAKQSETNAALSEASALESKNASAENAAKSQNNASNAKNSADSAKESETKAQEYSNLSQSNANASSESASNAKASEDASKKNADDSAATLQELKDGIASGNFKGDKGDPGPAGKDAPQIDDTTVTDSAPWSSKHIIDTLCPPLEEAGNPVVCYPVENYPLGVTASWKPTQAGTGEPYPAGGGKNLWGNLIQNTFVSQQGFAPGYTGAKTTQKIPCAEGDSYTLSAANSFAPAPGNIGVLAFFDETDAMLLRVANTYQKAFTLTAPANTAYVRASCYAETDADKVQLEKGSTATAYAPYENIRPISGRDSVKVERCGENLLNIAPFTKLTNKGITYEYVTNGGVHISGTATATVDSPVFAVGHLPPGKYYGLDMGTSIAASIVVRRNGANLWLNAKGAFEILAGDVIKYWYMIATNGATLDTTVYPYIVPGTTAPPPTPPYTGQTATLTLPRTIYGGTVDAVTGEGQETWGTETISRIASIDELTSVVRCTATLLQKSVTAKSGSAISNWLREEVSYVIDKESFYTNQTQIYIKISKTRLSSFDVAGVNAYLSEHPLTVCYKLAAPTPFAATGAQPIPALSGVNTVLTDADSVTVTGRADPIKRITDLEDAVASMTNT